MEFMTPTNSSNYGQIVRAFEISHRITECSNFNVVDSFGKSGEHIAQAVYYRGGYKVYKVHPRFLRRREST